MDGSQFVRPTGHEAWTPAAMQRRRLSLRQLLAGLVTLIAIIGFSVYARYYGTTGRYLVSTDNATVAADSVIISPRSLATCETRLAWLWSNGRGEVSYRLDTIRR